MSMLVDIYTGIVAYYYAFHCISVCVVPVGTEDQLSLNPVPAERQPRVQTSHRVLYIQA